MRELDYLKVMSREYPTRKDAISEMINLRAIMGLPKGTEYFFSDLHGEHLAFAHLLRSSSGMTRQKIRETFGHLIYEWEEKELANLIYYPERNLEKKEVEGKKTKEWESLIIYRLIKILRAVSSKYTRSKVRKRMPAEFAYIMDELLNVDNTDENKAVYYNELVQTIIDLGIADELIVALCNVIQKMTIDHLHIIGDVFDRGPRADMIMEELIHFGELDIQWGNHDVEWMGAASGNSALVCSALRSAFGYNNFDVLEDGYGINLRPISMFAARVYKDDPCERFYPKILDENIYDAVDPVQAAKMHKAIAIIMFKLDGNMIKAHPEYHMEERLVLEKIDYKRGVICLNGKEYPLRDSYFPTIDPKNPYQLTTEEEELVEVLTHSFEHSAVLKKHMQFLYAKGSMYLCYNNNLLFHACLPTDADGNFSKMEVEGTEYAGRELMEALERVIRDAYFLPTHHRRKKNCVDMMWYLWCGPKSPLFGKDAMKTFENYFVEDEKARVELPNAYYKLCEKEEFCDKVFKEFGMDTKQSHIINGHMPVKLKDGEKPIRANGKMFVIDGGLSKAYQKKTGIAGYTLIFTSRRLMLAEHSPFHLEKEKAAHVHIVETVEKRITVGQTDIGKELQVRIDDLKELADAYQKGHLKERIQ